MLTEWLQYVNESDNWSSVLLSCFPPILKVALRLEERSTRKRYTYNIYTSQSWVASVCASYVNMKSMTWMNENLYSQTKSFRSATGNLVELQPSLEGIP